MEIDPVYVDVAVLRWQSFTGKSAVLDGDGRSFAEITAERRRVQATSGSSASAAPVKAIAMPSPVNGGIIPPASPRRTLRSARMRLAKAKPATALAEPDRISAAARRSANSARPLALRYAAST